MTVENTLVAMMRELPEPPPAGEEKWKGFLRRAHRRMWGRKAAVVGAAGMTAFLGTSVFGETPPGPSPIAPTGRESEGPQQANDDRTATAERNDRKNPIVVALRGEPGSKVRAFRTSTVVFDRAPVEGGGFYYKLIRQNGKVLVRGRIQTPHCPGDGCRSPHRTRVPIRVGNEQRGFLVVTTTYHGKATATVRIKVVLKPDRA